MPKGSIGRDKSSDRTNQSAPLLPQASQTTNRSSSSTSRRRRSKLTSGGRWDWSYETENPKFSRSHDDHAFGIRFHVIKKSGMFGNTKTRQTLSVSVPERAIRLASSKKYVIFPTASVSRLTPQGDRTLEIRAAPHVGGKSTSFFSFGKKKSWVKLLEFESAANRDEFLSIIRGLNAVGGTVSSMYNRVGNVITSEKLMRGLMSLENEQGYEPPAPKSPLDETEFFRWFLLVSQDRDPNALLKRLEDSLTEDEASPSRRTSTATNQDKRLPATSLSKRGPLFCEPKLAPKESLIIVEDTVTFVAKLDSKEVRHVIGELVLTNLRLFFSVYESEMTSRTGMTAMNGVIGLAKYVGESSSENGDGATSAEDANGSERSGEAMLKFASNMSEKVQQDALFGRDLRASLPSLRFGRRPDTVFVTIGIFLSALVKVECKHSSLVVETVLGRQCVFQFDRGDSYLTTFVERVNEARKVPFFTVFISDSLPVSTPPIYESNAEFARQIGSSPAQLELYAPFDNSGYDLCSTYPNHLIVPLEFAKRAGKMDAVARFRSKARVPAVTWAHPNYNVVLARSSQPLTGIKQARCVEDEELLELMSGGKRMFVVDARGPAAVAGNQLVRGKGAEIPSNYPDVTFLFMGIGNIHTMRSSHERLAMACNPGSFDTERFLLKVEESKWLTHVRLVLDAGTRCAELLQLEQSSVLVHCSDGWDRTAQLVTLAQIILDPFYRTLQGLAVLIEKDWVSFGFKFKDRCIGTDEDEKSPIWIQFVDCLFQFWRQFPKHFEFNEDLLTLLARAPYSNRFATFGFNSESERTEGCRHNKPRAWEFWMETLARPEYRNSSFEPYDAPLWPNTSTKRIILWEAMHLKNDASAPISHYTSD